jgi:dolichol-phosphate mannosyltransferase
MLSIIIPTYNERENVQKLIPRVFAVLKKAQIKGEVIVVDDNSPDGTADAAAALRKNYPVIVIKRMGKRGLATAVIEGFRHANGTLIGVMDADCSHPPEKIPQLVRALGSCDMVFGSRHVKGGGIANWPRKRRIISRGASLLARPLTTVKDPMSGFFFFKKKILSGTVLDPRGYKIGLELVVKGNQAGVTEVPYVFRDRKTGKSKLDTKEMFAYLMHVLSLYGYRLKKKL